MLQSQLIKKITKKSTLKHLPIHILKNDIKNIENAIETKTTNLNPHIVPILNQKYFAYNMPQTNRFVNQKKRGDFRGLTKNGQFVGIAYHLKDGGYKLIT